MRLVSFDHLMSSNGNQEPFYLAHKAIPTDRYMMQNEDIEDHLELEFELLNQQWGMPHDRNIIEEPNLIQSDVGGIEVQS